MNESNDDILQTLVEYYRNKCSKLEYDFLVFKIESQKTISELAGRLSDIQGSGNDSRKES
jgi:hypothetical protein